LEGAFDKLKTDLECWRNQEDIVDRRRFKTGEGGGRIGRGWWEGEGE
jgi:hypothetical protein